MAVQPIQIVEYPMVASQEGTATYSGDYMQVAFFTSSKGSVENILVAMHNPARGEMIRAYMPLDTIKEIIKHADKINAAIEAEKKKQSKV